jgi:hypothetical protein
MRDVGDRGGAIGAIGKRVERCAMTGGWALRDDGGRWVVRDDGVR